VTAIIGRQAPHGPARQALDLALVNLAAAGGRPRCGEPGTRAYWTSDDAAERAQAANWCTGCRVLAECGEAADEQRETFGVWAGVDRTPRKRGRS
jgi:hypothetical protein